MIRYEYRKLREDDDPYWIDLIENDEVMLSAVYVSAGSLDTWQIKNGNEVVEDLNSPGQDNYRYAELTLLAHHMKRTL